MMLWISWADKGASIDTYRSAIRTSTGGALVWSEGRREINLKRRNVTARKGKAGHDRPERSERWALGIHLYIIAAAKASHTSRQVKQPMYVTKSLQSIIGPQAPPPRRAIPPLHKKRRCRE